MFLNELNRIVPQTTYRCRVILEVFTERNPCLGCRTELRAVQNGPTPNDQMPIVVYFVIPYHYGASGEALIRRYVELQLAHWIDQTNLIWEPNPR